MRLVRKLLMLGAMSASAIALTAGSASAQLEVHSEPGGEGCGEVTLEDHVVSGGCHIEAESLGTVKLYAYIPSMPPIVVSACDIYAEGFVGQDGSGYVAEVDFMAPSSGMVPCTRQACDEANETMLPWPASIVGGTIEMTFCVRAVNSQPGTGLPCEVHLPLSDSGSHDWLIGDGTEYFCESFEEAPLAIDGEYTTVPEGEKVEVAY